MHSSLLRRHRWQFITSASFTAHVYREIWKRQRRRQSNNDYTSLDSYRTPSIFLLKQFNWVIYSHNAFGILESFAFWSPFVFSASRTVKVWMLFADHWMDFLLELTILRRSIRFKLEIERSCATLSTFQILLDVTIRAPYDFLKKTRATNCR